MSSFGLLVEDSSPLISWAPAGAWTDSPGTDSLIPSYSGRSLHTTTTQGATATINFNGTGITIYGGNRPNYGTFSISVDGQELKSGTAASQNPTVKQVLGTVSGLPSGPHSVVLSNTGTAGIDIDYMEILSQIGSPGSQMTPTIIDDSDARFKYLPSESDWQTNSGDAFMNNTLHYSSTSNAQVSLSFKGDAVAVYGTVAPDHANIQVSIDGRSQTYNGGSGGIVSALRTQTLLFYGNELGDGDHQLLISSIPAEGTGPFLDIDSVTIYSVSGGGGTGGNNQNGGGAPTNKGPQPSVLPNTLPPPSASRQVPTGTIVGGVLGGLAAILVVLGLLFFLFRRRRQRISKDDITIPSSPYFPIQEPTMMEAGHGFTLVSPDALEPQDRLEPLRPTLSKRDSTHSIAPSYYHHEYSHSQRSSNASTAPMLPPDVPRLKMPRPPQAARLSSVENGPARPSQRPPPLNLSR